MYKRIDFSKLEGLATYQDTLDFLQMSYRDAISGIAKAFGQYVIIAGVDDLGANYGDGWVVIDGELLPFIGGLKDTKIIIEELSDTEVFGDDSVQTVYFTRRAKCGNVDGVDFTSFIRLTELGNISTTLSALVTTVSGLAVVPTGTIKMFSAAAAPSGWLLCQGQAVSRTTYAALFALIGTTYGAGNGTTTFNVPSMKGKFVVGYDSADADYNALGKTGGEKKHVLTISEMPSHNHTVTLRTSWGNDGGSQYAQGESAVAAGNINTGSQGGGQSHENRPPFIALNYIIKI